MINTFESVLGHAFQKISGCRDGAKCLGEEAPAEEAVPVEGETSVEEVAEEEAPAAESPTTSEGMPGDDDFAWDQDYIAEVPPIMMIDPYITGASPKTGFIGAEFGQTDDVFVRQNKMVYAEEPTKQLPPMREWIFTRLDTGATVGVKYNLVIILPIPTPGRVAMGKKMAAGEATPEEAADYQEYWNARATFVLDKADTVDGFFPVTVYE